jgi:hypothetical protein
MQLKSMRRLFGGPTRAERAGGGVKRTPKRRWLSNNPAETWSGNSLRSRRLVAKQKRGARVEDFLIDDASRKRRKEAKVQKAKMERTNARQRKAAKAQRAAKPRKRTKAAQCSGAIEREDQR